MSHAVMMESVAGRLDAFMAARELSSAASGVLKSVKALAGRVPHLTADAKARVVSARNVSAKNWYFTTTF